MLAKRRRQPKKDSLDKPYETRITGTPNKASTTTTFSIRELPSQTGEDSATTAAVKSATIKLGTCERIFKVSRKAGAKPKTNGNASIRRFSVCATFIDKVLSFLASAVAAN
jgi:hypothetical protein